jgi:glycerol-3-phosphate acyltransferase PlsY
VSELTAALVAFAGAYLVGSIPFAYVIVRLKTGEDITAHGSGNVGAMNVRRSTGSWALFVLAMLLDFAKGVAPVALARIVSPASAGPLIAQAAVAGAVVGHNYSLWMAYIKRRFHRTGKGLSTGAGALLAYDWQYFLAVVVVGLLTIAVTRYMMAGQVAAAATLPVTALVLGKTDWLFALLMGALVYAAHHRRFLGLLRGEEPKFYINDRQGPRG